MSFPYSDKKEYMQHIRKVIEEGPYNDTWESLTDFRMPDWFAAAKFGIFIHWGIYSVPAFANEWYSRNMYVEGSPEYEHHIKTYGPQKDFGYKDFIPMFRAEGFDADFWAKTFKEAGARYVVPVAEHHDGFAMYDSSFSHFCAKEMGPMRDIAGELSAAIEKHGMVYGASTHRAEHHWFMGAGKHIESDIKEPLGAGDLYWPSIKEQPDFNDLYSLPNPSEEFLIDWVCRTCEIIDKYQPKLLYFDWWIQHNAYKPYLRMIAAYYYNCGERWGFPTAICYKHNAMAFGSGIVDMERGKFAAAKSWHWQTDTAIARNSWCHTTSLDYKSSRELICYLIDVVSKNGNLLLNVGPMADGSFADEDAHILREIGKWLSVNGEAIYDTIPWRYAAEGPTLESNLAFSDDTSPEYTCEDFRFTSGKGAIYVSCLNYPANKQVLIKSFAMTDDAVTSKFHGIIKDVHVLGFDETPEWKLDERGLFVRTRTVKSEFPVVLKVVTD